MFPRAGPAARLSLERPDHGHAAVDPDGDDRRDHGHDGLARQISQARRQGQAGCAELEPGHAVNEPSPLGSEIRRMIQSSGPMPVWRYMELCLSHPEHGYYVARDPLGREGDFITAPEVSQMFGELIGLWSASVWR